MKVKWDRFEVYEDGSQSDRSYGSLTIGGKEYDVTIVDHTRPCAQEDDKHYRHDVTHAYEVTGLPFYIGADPFYAVGFENYPGLSSVGIDRNPGYESRESRYCYSGDRPEHTIEEVERLVVDAFVEAFCFDYDEELEKAKKELDKRQLLMDEALEYQKSANK